jgi:hypothetical protein
MFETALAFFIPYLGCGVVILSIVLFLDVMLAITVHGFMALHSRLDDEIQRDQEEVEAEKGPSSAVLTFGLVCLIICSWPIAVGWWLRNTVLGEATLLEKLLDRTKEEVEEVEEKEEEAS